MVNKESNKFNFFIPAEFVKCGKDGQEMYIKGIASSEVEDSDGETLLPSGYDITPLLRTGFLNYNHKASTDPSAIIGEPTKAEIINNGKDLYIEGFLYPDSKLARDTYELAQTLEKNSPNRRMGFSIEGKAIEKDPFNPKRITKAKITGVAITPCPKNPNTLLSIVKGEYSDLWIDNGDEENEEDKEKAMTAAAGEGVTQTEDVDGGKKVFDDLLNEKGLPKSATLKKSEVFSLIFDKYGDSIGSEIEKAKQIYNLTQEFNKKLYNMENSNGVTLSKALEDAFTFIDEHIELAKGEKTDNLDSKDDDKKEESKEEGKTEDKKENKEEDVEKGNDFNMGVETVTIPNTTYGGIETLLKTFVKGEIQKGRNESEIINDMVEKGCDYDFSSNLVKGCLEEMNALDANGGITKDGIATETAVVPESTHSSKSDSNPFNKSEDSAINNEDLEILKGELTSTFENVQNNLVKGIEDRFKALGNILINQKNISDKLESENTELKKSLSDIQQQLTNFGSQSRGMRSVTSSAQVVERFPELEKSESGKNAYQLSNPGSIARLTETLTSEFESKIQKGEDDKALGNAILQLALSKSLDDVAIREIGGTLSRLNIEIVK